MGRCLKPACKVSRRVGSDLGLKSRGSRDISTKCKLKVFPGEHGNRRKRITSNYATQLTSKQMIKYTYGILEKQFRNLYYDVSRKKGATGEYLLILLESRLDNLVYRMGFASTRAEARQLVSHKSICIINKHGEKVVSIPSYSVKLGDTIKVKESSKNQIRIKHALKCTEQIGFVDWLDVDVKSMCGVFVRNPSRRELSTEINEQLVVELYSK